MAWYVNLIMGILIGSFMASYWDWYRNGFKKLLGVLASKTEKKKGK